MKISIEQTKYYKYKIEFEDSPFEETLKFMRYLKDTFGWEEISYADKSWRFTKPIIIDIIRSKYQDVNIDSNVHLDAEEIELNNKKTELTNKKVEEIKTATTSKLKIKGIKGTLYDFQKLAVEFLIANNEKGMLALDTGLGKSLSSLAFIVHTNKKKTLIISPSSVKYCWLNECAKWSKLKAFVIDSNKTFSLQNYQKNDVIILNYDILKKHFELLSSVHFDCLILDESQFCFPYKTKILTDKGKLQIGDIVEKNIDCSVMSCDILNNVIEYKKIRNRFKHINNERLIKIKHLYGEIICTENHKIYTKERGYQKAIHLSNKETVYFVQKNILYKEKGKKYSKILFRKMCRILFEFSTTNKKSYSENKNSERKKEMSNMRKNIFCFAKKKTKILWNILFCNMESKSTRSERSSKFKNEGARRLLEREETSRNVCIDEEKNERSKISRNNIEWLLQMEKRKSRISNSLWWKWTINKATKIISKQNWITNRICYSHKRSKDKIQSATFMLQSGFSHTKQKNSDRNRWFFSLISKNKDIRQKEDKSIKLSRVESVEILEQGCYREHRQSNKRNQFVYNLEIDKNNNYFANGILVSNCKNSQTIRAKLCKQISKNINSIILLTATPLLNKPIELFQQLNIIDPIVWSNYYSYAKHYCAMWKSPWGMDVSGKSNIPELKEKIKPYILRKKKEDVLKELPDKNFIDVPIELDTETKSKYRLLEDSFVDYLRDIKSKNDNEIRKSMQAQALVKLGELRKITSEGKVEHAKEIIKSIIGSNEKVIVFSCYNSPIELLQNSFRKESVKIIGSTSSFDRQKAIDAFQNDDKIKIFFGGMLSANTGITLTAANNVLFVDYDWTPANMHQAIGRADRIGQKANKINVFQLIALNTIDQKMSKILAKKQSLIDNLIEGDEATINKSNTIIKDLFKSYAK